jgi:hypothetical protein
VAANPPPESTPVSMSTITASPYPFGPPTGSSMPASAATGSVVGPPWPSLAQVAATSRILPNAASDSAMSSTIGSEPGC